MIYNKMHHLAAKADCDAYMRLLLNCHQNNKGS
jgi:hypothetical protein